MIKIKEISIILFFWISARAGSSTILMAFGTPVSDYAILISGILMDLILIICCVAIIKKNKEKFPTERKSSLFAGTIWNGFIVGVTLLGFTLGEHAVEVITVSKIDIRIAYKLWDFHKFSTDSPDLISLELFITVVATSLLAPIAEELFFRKLMIVSLRQKYSATVAVLISSLVFSLLHFKSFHFVSTFVFAITLAMLFIKTGSILTCIAAHGFFNVFANFYDMYDFRPILTEQNLGSPLTWLSYLIAYAMSITALALIAIKFRHSDGKNNPPCAVECT